MGFDWNNIIRAILFAFFAGLTGLLAAVLGPTYDNLLVPSLQTDLLYPALSLNPVGGAASGFLGLASRFSTFLLGGLVDPALALVAAVIGLLYLFRASVGRIRSRLDLLLPRLVVAVLLANFTLPVAGAILSVAGATYPLMADFNGAPWQHWQNIGGYGELSWSWDNGLVAFIVTFVLFSLVLFLIATVQVRAALLAVLLVVLPVFTLLWPIRPLAGLARRGWLWFIELAFLPCVLIIPLQLAVGSPNPLIALAYLVVAAGSPYLISIAGQHLSGFGLGGGAGILSSGLQRGLAVGALGLESYTRGLPSGETAGRAGVKGLASPLRAIGRAPLPGGLPLALGEGIGRGLIHLAARKFPGAHRRPTDDKFPPAHFRHRGGR
ncbi:MAG TPA: hypothetical protein VJS68_02680 [Thermoplasmata archaeon]|nr:hypothetical protein [Thermoplasmata archaeon]